MTYLPRVAEEIRTIGLYDLVLQDVQKIAGKQRLTQAEILAIMEAHPEILQEYKEINVEYNLSNIHLRDIESEKLEEPCRSEAEEINRELAQLREIEKYTLPFEHSSTLVIIFSIEFFVLFSVQYFIVLLDLKAWQWWIYSLFASSVALAWWYAKKEQKKFAHNSARYAEQYTATLERIARLEERGCIRKSDLIIEECEEHV